MNLFCRLFGHTWVPVTEAPEQRWFTTKAGNTLEQAPVEEDRIRHLRRCQRCHAEQDDAPGRHDSDRPTSAA